MKKTKMILCSVLLAATTAACSQPQNQNNSQESSAVQNSAESTFSQAQETEGLPTVDPSGAEIHIPQQINTIGVLAPSFAQTLDSLGESDKIVLCDTQTATIVPDLQDLPQMDLMNPNMEQLLAIKPDVLFVSNMTLYDGTNPFQQLIDAGVCVVCVPTGDSLSDIQQDVLFISQVVGKQEQGQQLVESMQQEIERIAEIGKTISDKKTVYFEIAAAPDSYSFGNGVFLNEIVELIGAENLLADQEGWLKVDAEAVVAANPDVILTNVNYLDDPVQEILTRSGWENTNAVKNNDVYAIDNNASSLPNENVIDAINQMARAVYPEYYIYYK